MPCLLGYVHDQVFGARFLFRRHCCLRTRPDILFAIELGLIPTFAAAFLIVLSLTLTLL